MPWNVHVITAGEFGPCPEWMCLRQEGVDPGKNIPSYVYLVENGETNILVDASFSSVEDLKQHSPDMYIKRDKGIPECLSEYGLTPEDINLVVLTHLHWDHAGTFLEYPNAQVICQKAEYEWMEKHHSWEIGYVGWFAERLLKNKACFEFVDGSVNLLPGISLILCGGHTAGSQMVLVDTPKGLVLITGDNVMRYENLERNIPVGLFCDIYECMRALELGKKESTLCLPSHDWLTAERM